MNSSYTNDNECRCGHIENDESEFHPCHGVNYTCKKPAREYFYNSKTVCLNTEEKIEHEQTWACDECWKNFVDRLTSSRALARSLGYDVYVTIETCER